MTTFNCLTVNISKLPHYKKKTLLILWDCVTKFSTFVFVHRNLRFWLKKIRLWLNYFMFINLLHYCRESIFEQFSTVLQINKNKNLVKSNNRNFLNPLFKGQVNIDQLRMLMRVCTVPLKWECWWEFALSL